MSREKDKNNKPCESISNPADNCTEPRFQYSLELVATIAARFVDGNTNDNAAANRAIHFLDAVNKTIGGRMTWLRARNEAERLSQTIPQHLQFAKGIREITGKRTETEAAKHFREYLRLHLRVSDLGRPSHLTEKQVKTLLEPLANTKARAAEETRIEKITADFRDKGFFQGWLGSAKDEFKLFQARLVRPYRYSENGKKGGRPRGGRKKTKKSFARKLTRKK